MNKLLFGIGFIVMLLLQWSLPGKMIFDQQLAVNQGIPYKFKTEPIDPSDPFRGKYVWLNYEIGSFISNDTIWPHGADLYVYLETGEDGFAKVSQISKKELNIELDYVKTKVDYAFKKEVHFSLPFDRFYMEESKAFEAEIAMASANQVQRQQNQEPTSICYALVYINGGTTRLEDVFINDVSIIEVVLQNREKEKTTIN